MIRVYAVDTVRGAEALEAIEAGTPRLAPSDLRRSRTMADSLRRSEWRASHIGLRIAIEVEAGPDWRGVELQRDALGRPSLPAPAPAFSLSHTSGLALVAIGGRGEQIGVDVELRRPIELSPERRARMIVAGIAAGAGAPADLMMAWTRLEALGKARGTGVKEVLEAMRTRQSLSREDVAAGIERLAAEFDLVVVDLPVTARYAAALAGPRASGAPSLVPVPPETLALTAFIKARNAVDPEASRGQKEA